MTSEKPVTRISWKPIEPLRESDVLSNGSMGAVDALHAEWERRVGRLDEEERTAIRRRSLRRLAVETGIIERLYEVDWGLTLTLVAEGFTRDVVERAGGKVDDRTLATLRAQLDSLGMVLTFVREERNLTSAFIKELHQALTRTQETYTVTDALGRVVEAALLHGEWKREPNHVLRQDNSLLEYAPPEQVASEIDRLIELWDRLEQSAIHPVIKAAWLHHRFVQIHPFADGNGRVARALTLLVLEKHRFAPLVVDRWHRTDYLKALDAANDGKLQPLIRLFLKLEGAALTNELERPEELPSGGLALDVAHTLAAQIDAIQKQWKSDIQGKLTARAIAVKGRIDSWFDKKGREIDDVFKAKKLKEVEVLVSSEGTQSQKAGWFRRQIIDSARTAGHYADFSFHSSWSNLRVRVQNLQLSFVASVHGAGREPGVMAVTTFGEIRPRPPRRAQPGQGGDEEEQAGSQPQFLLTTKDAFRFLHAETTEQIDGRAGELEELLEEGLAEALLQLLKAV
jgi:fido (protein-threonine AMPylation protein)